MKLENEHAKRVHPKLRMIYNGDEIVNGNRAANSAVVTVTSSYRGGNDKGGELPVWKPANGVRISAFIELDREVDVTVPGARRRRQRGKLAAIQLPLKQLANLVEKHSDIAYVSCGEVLEPPNPITVAASVEDPTDRTIDDAPTIKSKSVLIGVIDVGGFDFAHPDFLDKTGKHTRFLRIWDQGLPEDPGSDSVEYGRELTQVQMDDAISAVTEFGLPATELLRQSAQLPGSHATHVASIAAGNAGVCSEAILAGVSIAIPDDENTRRKTFFDSVQLAHALDYLVDLAEELQVPVVINISLGTNGHAHDGTSPISRWIEAALDEPGRCVVVAAGNAGQNEPRFEGDLGFLSGRIHSSGRIDASGLDTDLEWEVLGNGLQDWSENEMEIWYEPQDRFDVKLKPPSSSEWLDVVAPGQFLENQLLDSNTLVSIYNERYHAANGANRISVFLSPRLRGDRAGVEAGTWIVRLHGANVRNGRFHAWIERDDFRPVRRIAGEADPTWGLPSMFSATSNVDDSSVNSLACGARVLAVANYDDANEHIHFSSSRGPTRDDRTKPEVAGPGTAISAANGFGRPDRPWIAKTGTSMASPYVAGVAARMLAAESRLTAAQIIGMMRRTAQPLPGDDYHWQNAAGFGRIEPGMCLGEVAAAFTETDLEEKS